MASNSLKQSSISSFFGCNPPKAQTQKRSHEDVKLYNAKYDNTKRKRIVVPSLKEDFKWLLVEESDEQPKFFCIYTKLNE